MVNILNRNLEETIEMIIDVHIDEDEMLNDLAVKFIKFACKEYGILPRKVSVEAHDLVGNNGMCFDEPDGKYTILTFLIVIDGGKKKHSQMLSHL